MREVNVKLRREAKWTAAKEELCLGLAHVTTKMEVVGR